MTAIPLIADAASAPRTFRELANQTVTVLSSATVTLVLLGLVIYIWGIASNMIKLGQGEGAAYKAYILWGVIILFVMVSIWGILGILRDTVFSGDAGGGGGGGVNQQTCTSLSDPGCNS